MQPTQHFRLNIDDSRRLRGRETVLYECDERSWIEAPVTSECHAELDAVASVIDWQSSEAYSHPGKSEGILGGVVESALFSSVGPSSRESFRGVGWSEQLLTRRIRPSLAPLAGGETRAFLLTAVVEVFVGPWQRPGPVA